MHRTVYDIFAKTNADELIDAQAYKVCQHLQHLLNCRQGSLCHLPDYGCPDLQVFFDHVEYYQSVIFEAVCRLLQVYEPRLYQITLSMNAHHSICIQGSIASNKFYRFMVDRCADSAVLVSIKAKAEQHE